MSTNKGTTQHEVPTLRAFIQRLVDELERAQRFTTARNYRRACDSFMKYRLGAPLRLDALTAAEVQRYNDYLFKNGLRRNTVSFYNRILRAAYNQAVLRNLVKQADPFKSVYTGVDVTRKRALSVEILRRIITMDIPEPDLAWSRDLFLFSFQTRGMSFVDMAFLTQSNIQAGFITYIRRKTGQVLSVQIEPWIEKLLARLKPFCTQPYLLPILHARDAKVAFREYQIALGRYDRLLKRLGQAVGAPFPLSSYSARHSWATIARDTAVPLAVISSGMGHTSEKTTRIYLASLDNSLVDRANQHVWESILAGRKD